jgi:hypothetical protein
MKKGIIPIELDKLFIKLKSKVEDKYKFKMLYRMEEDRSNDVNEFSYIQLKRLMRDKRVYSPRAPAKMITIGEGKYVSNPATKTNPTGKKAPPLAVRRARTTKMIV